jgi:hypothetical protein
MVMVPWITVPARIIALVLVTTAVAEAQPGERVVVVTSDGAFASALEDALVPAGMDVVAVGPIAPPATVELPARSRELADRQAAAATVWLLGAPGGATLVTYDRAVDRLFVRDLPYGSPLSATQAAETARMVRTMLRALRVTDELAPPPVGQPAPAPVGEPELAANVGVAAWFAAPGDHRIPAASLGVAWRPHGLGVALTGVAAPSAPIATAMFAGTVRDLVVAAEVRRAVLVAPAIRVTPAAGVALHAVRLEGSFGAGELVSRRFDPAVRLGGLATYALPGRLELGLAVWADALLLRQRYEVLAEQILEVARLQLVTALVVGVTI